MRNLSSNINNNMDDNIQRAAMCYACGRGFLRIIEEQLETGVVGDYLPLSLFVSLKIVEHGLYDKWEFVLETLEACDGLFRCTRLERLVRNARFTAWMLNAFIALKLFNAKCPLSILYIKSTITFLISDSKNSRNKANVRSAQQVENVFKQFFKNEHSRQKFSEMDIENFEPIRNRLYVLLDALHDLVAESYLTRYESVLSHFVLPADGVDGPDEATLRDRIQRTESHYVTRTFLALNDIVVLESQPQ